MVLHQQLRNSNPCGADLHLPLLAVEEEENLHNSFCMHLILHRIRKYTRRGHAR